jgi:hypothetical protein
MRHDLVLDYALDLSQRFALAALGQHHVRQRAEIHRFRAQLAPGYARQLQQVVDQLCHSLRGRPDP